MKADRDRAAQQARAEKLVRQLEDGAARERGAQPTAPGLRGAAPARARGDQGRAQIDHLLHVTQERLAGQTEKLIAAEDRVQGAGDRGHGDSQRLEVLEGDLRTHQMSDALRETRTHDAPDDLPAEGGSPLVADGQLEDRRASTPFIKELSIDAQKSLTPDHRDHADSSSTSVTRRSRHSS